MKRLLPFYPEQTLRADSRPEEKCNVNGTSTIYPFYFCRRKHGRMGTGSDLPSFLPFHRADQALGKSRFSCRPLQSALRHRTVRDLRHVLHYLPGTGSRWMAYKDTGDPDHDDCHDLSRVGYRLDLHYSYEHPPLGLHRQPV